MNHDLSPKNLDLAQEEKLAELELSQPQPSEAQAPWGAEYAARERQHVERDLPQQGIASILRGTVIQPHIPRRKK